MNRIDGNHSPADHASDASTLSNVSEPSNSEQQPLRPARASVTCVDHVAPAQQHPEQIIQRCELTLAEASASVHAARTGRPSLCELQAAASTVADAKRAFVTMRSEIHDSLQKLRHQMEEDIQQGIAGLATRAPLASNVRDTADDLGVNETCCPATNTRAGP